MLSQFMMIDSARPRKGNGRLGGMCSCCDEGFKKSSDDDLGVESPMYRQLNKKCSQTGQ